MAEVVGVVGLVLTVFDSLVKLKGTCDKLQRAWDGLSGLSDRVESLAQVTRSMADLLRSNPIEELAGTPSAQELFRLLETRLRSCQVDIKKWGPFLEFLLPWQGESWKSRQINKALIARAQPHFDEIVSRSQHHHSIINNTLAILHAYQNAHLDQKLSRLARTQSQMFNEIKERDENRQRLQAIQCGTPHHQLLRRRPTFSTIRVKITNVVQNAHFHPSEIETQQMKSKSDGHLVKIRSLLADQALDDAYSDGGEPDDASGSYRDSGSPRSHFFAREDPRFFIQGDESVSDSDAADVESRPHTRPLGEFEGLKVWWPFRCGRSCFRPVQRCGLRHVSIRYLIRDDRCRLCGPYIGETEGNLPENSPGWYRSWGKASRDMDHAKHLAQEHEWFATCDNVVCLSEKDLENHLSFHRMTIIEYDDDGQHKEAERCPAQDNCADFSRLDCFVVGLMLGMLIPPFIGLIVSWNLGLCIGRCRR